ncbi:hypothetical protein MKX01_014627, partial [Papaver californicum]
MSRERFIVILGSCNGLVCIQLNRDTDIWNPIRNPICIWNPSTKEYKQVPESP